MIKNYIKTAIRNLWKNKSTAGINILGLTIGFACCMLIGLYIQQEWEVDRYQERGDRIARVIMEYSFSGSSATGKGDFTSVRVAPVLKQHFPEVEESVTITKTSRVIRHGDKLINEKRFFYSTPAFFRLFSYHLLTGDPGTVLNAPNQLLLTEEMAIKYFGNTNPIGQFLQVGTDSGLYRIAGVMANYPQSSSMKCDFIASFSSLGIEKEYYDSYWDANYTTFLLLHKPGDIPALESRLPAFMKEEMKGAGATVNFYLEPYNRIHLHSEFDSFEPNGSIDNLYILAAVAALILIIAGFTYVNLGTARSLERAREVGLRKVVGASRRQVFFQFMGESLIICVMAVLLAAALAALLLPAYNQVTGESYSMNQLISGPILLYCAITALLVSFLAGLYPALMLSNFQPIKVLKGRFGHTGSGQLVRQSLIVFQFAISIFLIISTMVVHRQLNFIQARNLGYDRNHVLVLPMDGRMLDRMPVIREELRKNADVISVSRCVRSPVEGGGGYNMRTAEMPETEQIAVTANPVDEEFISTVGMELIAGTNFTRQDIEDVADEKGKDRVYHFILNEAAVATLGWTPQEAIGKRLFMGGSRPGFVKGVVRNFHFESLHHAIKPFILFPEIRGRELLVKVTGKHLPNTIDFLQQTWNRLVPDRPFEYRFLDQDYNNLYQSETRLGTLMNGFAVLAIFLACLGLFGLSSYAAQRRIREIGIRRTLGAPVRNLVAIMTRPFVVLSIIAIAAAFPLAWWAASSWLGDFSYRIQIGWSVFVVAGLATISLTLLTVGFHAVRSALNNPVTSLRSE